MSVWGSGGFRDEAPDLSRKVTREMPLHDGTRLGMGAEILLQCPNLPTHGTQWLDCHRIHIGGDPVEDESGAYDVTGDQIPEHAPIFGYPHFATNNERNGVRKLAPLYEALANFSRDPRSDTQN